MHKRHIGKTQKIKRISYIAIVCFLMVIMATQTIAGNISEYQKRLDENKSDISYYKKQIKKTTDDLNWRKHQREQIISELEQMNIQQEEIEQQIQLIESAITSLDEAIALTEEECEQQEALLKERLRIMYKKTSTISKIEELFKSSSWNELFIRVRLMNQVSEYDKMLLNSVKDKKEEIEQLKEQRQYEIDNCVERAKSCTQQIQELEVSRSSLDTAIQKDQQTKQQYERDQDALIKQSSEIEQLIKNLQRQGDLKWGGKMVWPMPTNKTIHSKYGNRLHPIYKVWKMHTGIDVGAKWEEAIVAAADGVVLYAGTRGGYGNCIIIDHGSGMTTLYAHIINRGILVKNGQVVSAGQTIAKAGSTGLSTGPHLHFEVRKDGATQDPLDYVRP